MRLVIAILLSLLIFSNCSAREIVLPPGTSVEGKNASDLSAEWWQWAMSAPDGTNPVEDTKGINCGVGQRGKVWFLAGGFGPSKIRRTCTIPANRHLFFPVINMAYWPRQDNDKYTCQEAKQGAALNNDTALDLFAEIDGVSVKDIKRFRVATEKCFDIYARVPPSQGAFKAYPSASDGYWLLLSPLPKGKHTIKFGGRYNNKSNAYGRSFQDIEYELLVQ